MKTDEKVLELIKKVEEKRNSITKSSRPRYKTNCTLNISRKNYNIQSINDVELLVTIYAELLIKSNFYNQAKTELNVDIDFVYDGYILNDWKHDIQARINKIKIQEEKKKLKLLEDKLDKLKSTELRAELELQSIEEELNG